MNHPQEAKVPAPEEQRGIVCPRCGCAHFRVIYTRARWGGRIIRRREYGKDNPVQRYRNHKRKNVLNHVSDPLKDTVKATMNAAYRLEADPGRARLEQLAKMLEKEHPSAAASLREGLAETFTVNRLGLT